MIVYRISKKKYIDDLSGYGAKLYGGRWNRPGRAVLYTSHAKSLAMLELIVHFSTKHAFRQRYKFARINIDESKIVSLTESDHNNIDLLRPNNDTLWNITDHYFQKKNILGLKVPSVLIADEYNYILNPEYNSYESIKIEGIENVLFDERFAQLIRE